LDTSVYPYTSGPLLGNRIANSCNPERRAVYQMHPAFQSGY